MVVREIRPEEYEELGRLTEAAYRSLEHELEAFYAAELRDVKSRAEAAVVLVALDEDGDVVGGVTYVPGPDNPLAEFEDPHAAGFRMLAVRSEARGMRVGEALVQACLHRAMAEGRHRLVLHSTPWMRSAHRLYERLGFKRAQELDWRPLPTVPLWGFVYELQNAGRQTP